MASQNGFSNGVNGTTDVLEVEHTATMEVKSIQNISIDSETVQQKVSQPAVVEAEVTPAVTPQVEEITTLPAEVTVQDPVEAIQQNVVEETVFSQVEEITTLLVDVAVKNAVEEIQENVAQEIASPQAEEVTVQSLVEEIQQDVVPEIAPVAAPQVEDITTLPVEVTVQEAVEEIVQEVTAPSVSATTEVNGVSPVVDAQPQVILETPVVDVPETKLPGNQPGTSDFQVPQYAIDALNRIAQEQGFTNYVINYDRGSKFGDGFVAEIVRAKINGTRLVKGAQEDSELVLVVKLPPENKLRREQMGMSVFEREATMYNEVLPMFQKFQLDKGLKPGQGFVSFPKCYYASHDKEKNEAVIIMEDIRTKGFKMLNKYKPVDYPHAQAVLETVAQLHGLSLAMKDQCPAVFEKFKGLKDQMSDPAATDMMKAITASNCEKALTTLEPHEENIKQKLRAFSENIIDIIKSCSSGELSEPYSVISHGDCWVNNIMFKYERGNPRHISLLDWQISRYSSPVLDICYFIYNCTDSALRAQHFDNLIQGYHIALRKQVELLGSDVNQILPFTAFLREMKTKAKFALSMAIFIIPMLCTPNDELPNMDEMVETLAAGEVREDGFFDMSSGTESAYKIRMGGIIRDMYKKGYL